MDFLKKVANQHQGNAATQPGDAAAQQTNPAAGSEQEDYVDKGNLETPEMINGVADKTPTGVDAIEKKFGVDPAKQRQQNEQATDKAREFLEGKGVHIPKSVSRWSCWLCGCVGNTESQC